MSENSLNAAVGSRPSGAGPHGQGYTAVDPLSLYENSAVGSEFRPPGIGERDARSNDRRRDEVIIKTWRGVPTIKDEDSQSVRHGLSSVRDFEVKNAEDADRAFLILLCVLTVLLAVMFAFFVANMRG